MPDKKIKVTDPKLLAQLNDESTPASAPILQQVEESFSDLPDDKKGLMLAQVRHETGRKDLQSNVAVQNNNVSGITWNENFPAEWKGTSRPSSEGGNYVKFPTINDWSKAYKDTLHKDKGYGSPLDANTIEEFAHRLKQNGYYTASEKDYLAGLKKMSDIRREKVTDPSILAQLNDEIPISQKKSPFGSESGSVTSASVPQNGLPSTDGAATTPTETNVIPSSIAAPQRPQVKDDFTDVDPITHLPKRKLSLEEQIINQYPVLKKVAPADQFHIDYATGDDASTLKGLGHNPEYISPNEGVSDENSGGISIPKGKMLVNDDAGNPKYVNVKYPGHHTTLINSEGLSEDQIKKIASNDFLSHTLHKIPEYNDLTSQLDSELKKAYGEKMVKGNGGVDAYVRGIIDNSPEYQSYRDELKKVNPALVKKINDFVNQKETPQQSNIQGLTEIDPITHLPKSEPVSEQQQRDQIADKTNNAVQVISKDLLDNFDNHHPQDQQNIASIPLHEPGNLLHDITNPHGNPELTSNYLKDRTAQLQQQRAQEINAAGFNDPFKAAGANPQTLTDINNNYDQKAEQIKQSANHLLELQLFNKEYTDKKYTQKEASTAKDAAEKQRQDAIKAANDHLSEKVKGVDKYDTDKATSEFHAEVRNINEGYGKNIAEINSGTKYDDVKMGLEHARLSGDPKAEQDYERYNSGKALSPEDKLKYQLQGQQIISTGTNATSNENVAKEGAAHLKDNKQIEKENQPLFNNRRAQAIGAAISNDENPIYRAIVPHFGSVSKEDMEAKGKELGYTSEQLKKLDPENIPTPASMWSPFAKGVLNSAAPIYEQGVRMAGRIAGANPEDVNEAFPAGWESQRGPGAALVGNSVPSTTNGTLGQVMEGLGGLAMLPGMIGGPNKLTGELEGLTKIARTFTNSTEGAHQLANFGLMAFNGYNNAYHDAKEVIGDKPGDEWKRQAYASTMGAIEGAIFSIPGASPAELAERAIGLNGAKEGGLIGRDFLKEMAEAKYPSFLQSPSGIKKLAQVVLESAKDNGKQISLASASEIAKNTVNTVLNPKKQTNLAEDLKNTAITTALTMAIPSLMAGLNHVAMQTPMAKDAMFDIGAHPEKYTQELQSQVDKKLITPEQAQKSHEAITTMKAIIDNTPIADSKGQPLPPDQIKDYAWNLLRQHTLQGKVDQITEQATQSNIAPDKAQVDPINKEISELEGERTKIISGKGAKRLPTPLPEKVEETPNAERSVATKDEENPSGEKKENISPLENEKDISLQSQSITEKNNDHGNSIEENNGRQSNSSTEESQEQRQSTELRETAHSNGGNEQEKDRLLSKGEEPEGNREPQAETEQPAAIPVKEKKNRFAKIEEKTPVIAEEAKPEETQSQTKTESDATIHSEEQKQEVHPEVREQEHAPVEPARGEAEAASTENSDSHISGKAEEEIITPKENVPRETEPIIPVSEHESTQEKPTQEKTAARSVATEADKVPEVDQQKSPLSSAVDNFNKYKDAVIKKESALQKLHDEGKRKGDESYDKKVAELEQAKNKKLEAFKEYEKQFRKDQSTNNKSLSKTIREKTDKLAARADKNKTKGVTKAGLGSSDGDLIKLIGNKVADLVEFGENIHLAIRKALDEFRGQLSKDQEQELKTTLQQGEHVEKYRDNLKHEPPFLAHKEDHDLAVDLIKEIKAGNDTLEDVMDDLHEANISPERKKVIADFIDREVHAPKEKSNADGSAKKEPNKLDDYTMKDSGLSEYLGKETTKDVVGEDNFFGNDEEKKAALKLTDLVEDANKMTSAYKKEGEPASKWGKQMLSDIENIADNPKKQGTFIAGLHIELQKHLFDIKKQLSEYDEALKSEKDQAKIEDIQKGRLKVIDEYNKLTKLIGDVQNFGKKLASTASDVLNTRRLDRWLRDDILKDQYHDKILSEQEKKRQKEVEKALNEQILEGYKKTKEFKENTDESKRSEARKKKEESSQKKEGALNKIKNTIKRMSGRSVDKVKAERAKVQKEKAMEQFPRDDKGNVMTPEQFKEYLKKLKNPC